MPISTQETLKIPDPPSMGNVPAPERLAESEHVQENPSFDEIPKEVLLHIGVYDTDCAGGCG